MSVFLLRGDGETQTRSPIEGGLPAAIPGLIEVSSFKGVFDGSSKSNGRDPTIVLVTAPSDDQGYFDRLVDVAAQYHDEIFLVLISDEISASDYKRLVRTGAADWVSAKSGVGEVTDIIEHRRQQAFTPNGVAVGVGESRRPVTISFVPSAGGVGNSTLILETAALLKKEKKTQQRKICVIDLDFQTSHVCDYLDSEPRLHIEEFSGAPERLDGHLFETFTTHHSSGIDVLAAPRSKFSSERLNINALDTLFSMITKRYDLVFIDYPLTWFSWIPQLIGASDAAVVTGINTIPCLRQISETLVQVRSSAASSLQVAVALNRCERTLLGTIARRKYVERVLQDAQVFYISERAEVIESVNMGIPIMLGDSGTKLQSELAPLGEFCANVTSTRPVLRA
ncbi:MAG TPA: AAA family ATPase [Xanthobacteraceae bacterium]|nr:AAA family ATPase [Xanthobacteraceae bacterium]